MSDGAVDEGPSLKAENLVTALNSGAAAAPHRRLWSMSSVDQITQRGTIVLLYANTGGGHKAAAQAVAGEITRVSPDGFTVSLVDAAAISPSRVVRWGARTYGPMTRRAPKLWGAIFYASNSAVAVALLRRTVLRPSRLPTAPPDDSLPLAVVSFHALLSHIAVATPRRGPAITVVTDMVTIHRSWASRGVDTVVTSSAAARERMGTYSRRDDGGTVVEVGLPVARPFWEMADRGERHQLRCKLGLGPGFVILLFGGGEGSGGLVRQARALLTSCPDVTVAVICGRNKTAKARLDRMAVDCGGRLVVGGFVDNVEEWMVASDLVAARAGPGVIAEALVCGKPLLLTGHLPGQERGNAEWVVSHGAGLHVRKLPQLIDAVLTLTDDPSQLAAMAGRARDVARPEASTTIAGLVLSAACRAAALGA